MDERTIHLLLTLVFIGLIGGSFFEATGLSRTDYF